jgi:hypothetical protein
MPPVKVSLQSTTFGGQFLSSISMAFVGGLIIAFPFIFYQIWSFIKPALTTKMPVKVSYAYSIGLHFLCEEDTRLFASVKQRDMCLRLHKTKCQQCREHAWVDCKKESRINANKDPQKHKVMDEIKDAHKLGY